MINPVEAVAVGAIIGLAVSPAVAVVVNWYTAGLAEWTTNSDYKYFPTWRSRAVRYTGIAFLSTTLGGIVGAASAGLFF